VDRPHTAFFVKKINVFMDEIPIGSVMSQDEKRKILDRTYQFCSKLNFKSLKENYNGTQLVLFN
jgi:hypothetical protein